jgi:exodeoxyribonuclease VII small subunit
LGLLVVTAYEYKDKILEKQSDIKNLSFEQAMSELEAIVRKLEAGQGALESSIKDYERGTLLKAHCQKKLQDAKMKVEKIVTGADGSLAVAAFDEEEK